VVVKTLVGEYVEKSVNHNRKVWQKVLDRRDPNAVDVFLYYWDGRDGEAFEGWWFGNKVGGTQVWSQCKDSGMLPPTTGWKIPWDGPVRTTLAVVSKAELEKQKAAEKTKVIREDISAVTSGTAKALEKAKELLGDSPDKEAFTKAEELLKEQVASLTDAQKKVVEASRGATGELAKAFQQIAGQVQEAQKNVASESSKLTAARKQMEQDEKNKELEAKDIAVWTPMLEEATKKANGVDDSVEKALITFEMIEAGGSDLDEVKAAVDQTEAAFKASQEVVSEAKVLFNANLTSARRFVSGKIRDEAVAEIGRLQERMAESQNKLAPLRTARQDLAVRQATQRLLKEVLDQLEPAEVEVERAEELASELGGEGLTKEALQQAEEAHAKASEQISDALKLMEQRKKAAPSGPAADEEFKKLDERAKQGQEKLANLKGAHKNAHERVSCEALLEEAADKLRVVQEAIRKATDAEGPFLMGVEELPLDEALAAVKECEVAANAANVTASTAGMFIKTKIVEVRRLSTTPSKDATEKLTGFQKQLEGFLQRLSELKKSTAKRKAAALMREGENVVLSAEAAAQKCTEAADALADDTKLSDLDAASDTLEAEAAATTALTEARKFITTRQIESKGKDSSPEVCAEIARLQARITAAQSQVQKTKKISSSFEQRIAVKRAIEESENKLKAAEQNVVTVQEILTTLEATDSGSDDGTEPEAAVTEATTLVAKTTAELKLVTRSLNDSQRTQPDAKEEIQKFIPRAVEAQKKLDAASKSLKERSEKIVVRGIVKELEEKVGDAEENVKKCLEAEAPLHKGVEEMTVEEASAALQAIDSGAKTAQETVRSAMTFLASKKIAARKITSATAAKAVEAEMEKIKARLDAALKQLGAMTKGVGDRRVQVVRREVSGKQAEAEELLKVAVEASTAVANRVNGGSDPNLGDEQMKTEFEKAAEELKVAEQNVSAVIKLLDNRRNELKNVNLEEATIASEISKSQFRAKTMMQEVVKQKQAILDASLRWSSQQKQKELETILEHLDSSVANAKEVAAPLISTDKKVNFTAAMFLSEVVAKLKEHMQSTSKTPADLFKEMSDEGKLKEAKFVAFVRQLPEIRAQRSWDFSQEVLQQCFRHMCAESGDVDEAGFLEELRTRYFCSQTITMTENLTVKGSKTTARILVNDVVEALGEVVKDDLGLRRIRAKTEKDGKEGYITLCNASGTTYLQPFSPFVACQRRVEKALASLGDETVKASKKFEEKRKELEELDSQMATQQMLNRQKMRIASARTQLERMQKLVTEAMQREVAQMQMQRKRNKEIAETKAVEGLVFEAESECGELEVEVAKKLEEVEASRKATPDNDDERVKTMIGLEKDFAALLDKIHVLQATVAQHTTARQAAPRAGPAKPDGSMQLSQIKMRVQRMEVKTRQKRLALKKECDEVRDDAHKAVHQALCQQAQKEGLQVDALFKELGGKDGGCVSAERLRKYIEQISDADVKAQQLDLGLELFEKAGLSKFSFQALLQDYVKCAMPVALYTERLVKDAGSKPIRRLQAGEVAEVVERGRDEAVGVERVRCRMLMDGQEGWASLAGNKGTVLLEATPKPYYTCDEATRLHASAEADSDEVGWVQPGEVLELIEGPRKMAPREVTRVRGYTTSSGERRPGWATLQDAKGNANLELQNIYACVKGIAITPEFDLQKGKAVRKIEEGELLEVLEEPMEDVKKGMFRAKAKLLSDGKEGWVTLRGNHGTTYAEETRKHYVCRQSVPLSNLFDGTGVQRWLKEGELLVVEEGPKTATGDAEERVKGRVLGSGAAREGWFQASGNATRWFPNYRCARDTDMHDALEVASAKVLRTLAKGEELHALDAPVQVGDATLRVHALASKDATTGFVTVRVGEEPEFLTMQPQ